MTQAISRRKKRPKKLGVIHRMETAGPSSEKLRQLVKKHPAPQQWYDEENDSNGKRRG